MTLNLEIGIYKGKHDDTEQLFMLDKQGNLTGIEGLYITPEDIENRPLWDFRPVFVLDLSKPHEFLRALESVLPDNVDEFNSANQRKLQALYDQINSQLLFPRIKEPGAGELIAAQHMELVGAVERLKEEPCNLIHLHGRSYEPWYCIDCKKPFAWNGLQNQQLVEVAE